MDAIHVSELPPELVGRRPLGQKVLLTKEILGIYCRIRLRLWKDKFPTVLAELRDAPSAHGSQPQSAVTYLRAARLAHAVQRILGPFPTDIPCLMQSLVLTVLLARRGIETTLLIGVKPGDEFKAHAWVEYCQRPLLPDLQDSYQLLTQL